MTKGRLTLFALLMAAATLPASAADTVLWDDSGKALLSGTYNFREVMWRNHGDFHRIAIYGSMQFDGNGGYTLTSSVMDSSVGTVQPFSTTGAYRISASGMGFMDDPIHTTLGKPLSAIWGLISQGVFIGSSNDDSINNLFIASRAPSSPTNASFSGKYWAADVNLPSNDVTQARDMMFPLNPDGLGGLGNLSLTGLIGTGGTPVLQTVNLASYSFANGAMTLAFGGTLGTQTLIAGNELCYLSADGNFFFGGSATGWDMIVGVRAFAGSVPANAMSGMYYQAGVDVAPVKGFDNLASYFGAFSVTAGTIIGHQRVLTADPQVGYVPFDYTYSDTLTLKSDGTHDDFLGIHNVLGAGGAIQIGFGNQSRLGINITLKAPAFSGSGVFLDPTGIANAASSAPFTVGVSPGGFIALYGTNLASAPAQDARMPLTLGGVHVLINGRPAPLYVVSPGFISGIVPYGTSGTVASIQVINDIGASPVRTVRVKNGTPGIYTNPAGGVGYLIAQHLSYATITPQNPAHPGETILLYLTGLGSVNPPLANDNDPAPSDHLTNAVIKPFALVDQESAAVGFAGLTPTIVGLYAITLTIPADISPGDVYVDIALPDSYTTEAQIPIGGSSLTLQHLDPAPASSKPQNRTRKPRVDRVPAR